MSASLDSDRSIEEATKIRNLTVLHVGHEVKKVLVGSSNLRQVLRSGFDDITLQMRALRSYEGKVALPESYSTVFVAVFDAAWDLDGSGNACLAAFLSTFLFDSMTPLWSALVACGQHLLAIHVWTAILRLAHEWERRSGKTTHKGSPYAFLAYTYLMMGNFDAAFAYIYNAIEEDRRLGRACPKISYPAQAPVYRTATLSDDPHNIMYSDVSVIRSAIETEIKTYRRVFGSSFSMQDFDARFLRNPDLEVVAFFFVFAYWSIVEHRERIGNDLMRNDFSRLKNAQRLFALCLVIDQLLHEHPSYTGASIRKEIRNFVEKQGLMTRTSFDALLKDENVARADPDCLLPSILSQSLTHDGKPVRKEVQYLLAAWKLRNFAAHNIQTQRVIGEDFDRIVSVLLDDVFLILEEYPP